MLRTWLVRLAAIELTLSVRSLHTPPTPFTCAWPPSLPSVPTSRATRVTSAAKAFSWSTIVLTVSLSSRISPFTSTVILRERSPRALRRALAVFAHLAGEVGGHRVHVVGEVLPYPRHAFHLRLTAELAVGAHFARHARYLAGEGVELVHHRVDRGLERENLALHVHRDLLSQVPGGGRGGHIRDVAHLAGEVRGHGVHVVGQVLPHARHTEHLRLAAELAFRSDLARDARHLARKGVELIDHRVDGALQLQHLALDVHGDL